MATFYKNSAYCNDPLDYMVTMIYSLGGFERRFTFPVEVRTHPFCGMLLDLFGAQCALKKNLR